MPYFFSLIDNSIPICRLLLYSLSVLILVLMSSPEECSSFKESSSPIGRVQSGLAASFIFESRNNEQANLLNNNINKEKWTEEEHKIFMQEYEKYGINCMQIAKVLSTRMLKLKSMLNVFSIKIWKQILQQWNNIESPSLLIRKHRSWSMILLHIKNNGRLSHRRTKHKCYVIMLLHTKTNESLSLLMTKFEF